MQPPSKYWMSLVLVAAAALAGCASGPTDAPSAAAEPEQATPAATAAVVEARLKTMRWTLRAATDAQGQRLGVLFPRPAARLRMDFVGARVGLEGACNAMGGGYKVSADSDGTQLQIGPLMSTRKGCEPGLAAADATLSALVAQSAKLRLEDGIATRLRLVFPTGESLLWIGSAKP